jgi:hypothetical protein
VPPGQPLSIVDGRFPAQAVSAGEPPLPPGGPLSIVDGCYHAQAV